MPRFHFNVYDGRESTDPKVTDLDSYETARRHAIALAGKMLTKESHEPSLGDEWRVEVTDDRGLILYRIDISVAGSAALSRKQA